MSARPSDIVLALALLCLTAGCARNSSDARGADTPENAALQYMTAVAHLDPKGETAASCAVKPGTPDRAVSMLQPDKDAVISVIGSTNPSPETWNVQVDWVRPSSPHSHHLMSLPVVREGQRYFVCF